MTLKFKDLTPHPFYYRCDHDLKNTKGIHKNTLDSHIRKTTTKGLQRVMDRVKHGKVEKNNFQTTTT